MGCWHGLVAVLNRVARIGLIRDAGFDQRLKKKKMKLAKQRTGCRVF